EMGGWESIEMVRRYAHLAPNHLTEHSESPAGAPDRRQIADSPKPRCRGELFWD
ncbi:hypothetical protein ACE400_26450, partial [Salmonella enterica]|uniref:hypothetical protein n=1 Tax=Salmonella enterica TaxID=28901 RepID=UPI003D276AB3